MNSPLDQTARDAGAPCSLNPRLDGAAIEAAGVPLVPIDPRIA